MNETKFKRNFLGLNFKEMKALKSWEHRHYNNSGHKGFKLEKLRGPIGSAIFAVCTQCNLEQDITDYETW